MRASLARRPFSAQKRRIRRDLRGTRRQLAGELPDIAAHNEIAQLCIAAKKCPKLVQTRR
jgi:hypothetical protein